MLMWKKVRTCSRRLLSINFIVTFLVPAIENESRGQCASRIVGVAWLLFESSDYFIQHFRRRGNYSRAATNRERRLIEQIATVHDMTVGDPLGENANVYFFISMQERC